MKIVVHANCCGFGLDVAEEFKNFVEKFSDETNRMHPELIEFVENHSDKCGSLKIKEFPDNATDWEIKSQNDLETISYVVEGTIFHENELITPPTTEEKRKGVYYYNSCFHDYYYENEEEIFRELAYSTGAYITGIVKWGIIHPPYWVREQKIFYLLYRTTSGSLIQVQRTIHQKENKPTYKKFYNIEQTIRKKVQTEAGIGFNYRVLTHFMKNPTIKDLKNNLFKV